MSGVFRAELDRAVKSIWFFVPLGIGVGVAIWAAVSNIEFQYTVSFAMDMTEWHSLGASGAFASWLFVDTGYIASLFFFLLPLLAIVPYSWTLRSDLTGGLLAHQLVRAPRRQVLAARALVAFVVSGALVAIPLVVNFAILLLFVPASLPEVASNLYIGMNAHATGARLFFTEPAAYVVLNTALDFALCGLWGVFVLGLSRLIDNRVVLIVGAFLCAVVAQYINVNFFDFVDVNGFRFNISQLLYQGAMSWPLTLAPTALFAALLALASAGLFWSAGRRDAL